MGRRELALEPILRRIHGSPGKVARARAADLPASMQRHLMDLYRRLGGVLEFPVFAPGAWDFAFADGFLLELDEDLHFNRYRAETLELPWSTDLPWTEDYREQCLRGEEMCWKAGRLGGKWTSVATVKMFGPGAAPGSYEAGGSPRWKQRALYDAVKDAYAYCSDAHTFVRISIHDEIDGVRVDDFLQGRREIPEDALAEFLSRRTIGKQ